MRNTCLYSVAVSFAVLLGGCYHPKIADVSFRCGPGGLCPEGYVCNALMLCAQVGGTGGVDLSGVDAGPLFSGRIGKIDLTGSTGVLTCSTKTGEMKLNDVAGTVIVAASSDGFSVVNQGSGPQVAIWSFSYFFVPAGLTLKPGPGTDALPVFASSGELKINGAIDWRGFGGFGNLPGMDGAGKMSGAASGGGAGVNDGGGGGGGYADVGGTGLASTGGAGGVAYGAPNLMPLHAGSGGGGGGAAGGNGGNGGGGIALIAAGSLTVAGKLDASGVAGFDANSSGGGGGGGGSGGSILLSGAMVTLASGHELAARGGNGGKGTGTGGAGGVGAAGRIWIGGQFSVEGTVVSDPMPTTEAMQLTSFPAQ